MNYNFSLLHHLNEKQVAIKCLNGRKTVVAIFVTTFN